MPTFSNTSLHEEHTDIAALARALRPPPHDLHTLQHFCPSISPNSSCLDTLLFRGILLVAYAAADQVVIARGTDLSAIRRLTLPSSIQSNTNQSSKVTALAFRPTDAAITAAFGSNLIVFQGWNDTARERGFVYQSSDIETSLTISTKNPITALAWDSSGRILSAISHPIQIWNVDTSYRPAKYTSLATIKPYTPSSTPLSLAALSPDGTLLAAAPLYATQSYVWALPTINLSNKSTSNRPIPCAEITHGRSGVASLDWKRRGGGNHALMSVDRDGTLSLWIKSSSSKLYRQQNQTTPSTNPIYSRNDWMQEIARGPHAERTPRAAATFLAWGGGGGVADDEGDALATNAGPAFLAKGTAPKPSRCYHWLIRVAGGDIRAWRVRGLDDRPRAEYTRLEPGSGESLLAMEDEHDDDHVDYHSNSHQYDPEKTPTPRPLRDVSIACVRAHAPIPFTTSSQYKIGLVKSYAISNGERRLRSPEPPEPPNIVVSFVLGVRSGLPFLARYDICPTTAEPAVCRARIGVGHTSPVVDLIPNLSMRSGMLGSGGWLASRGARGDVLLWRTNVSTGAWESMTPVATLPGPHSAVAVAPPRTSSCNRWEISVFSTDAALGSLYLFQFINFVSRKDYFAAQDVQFAKQVAVCHPRGRGGISSDIITQLIPVPFDNPNNDSLRNSTCVVFGLRESGRLLAWYVTRKNKDILSMEPCVIRTVGGKQDVITCAAESDLITSGKRIFVTGGRDGSIYVYVVAESEGSTMPSDTDSTDIDEESKDEDADDDIDDGVIWLRELQHLADDESKDDEVVKVQVMQGGSRILSVHASGRCVAWARSSSETTTWRPELVIPTEESSTLELENNIVSDGISHQKHSTGSKLSASIGFDNDGDCSVVVLRPDGSFDRYKRVLGMPWERIRKKQLPQEKIQAQAQHTIVHIGKGVVVVTSGLGLSVLGMANSESKPLSFLAGTTGYSPSKALIAHVLTGGRANHVINSLKELHEFIRKVTKRKASEASYRVGHGLIPPPPSLAMLISSRDEAPMTANEVSSTDASASPAALNPFQFSARRNVFAELMAKSEVRLGNDAANGKDDDAENDDDDSDNLENLSKLASRLRVVSLAGITRSEQAVLAAIARACASLKSILSSLDVTGARFALIASCYRELTKRDPLPLPIVACAVHSSSSDALLNYFLPAVIPGASRPKDSINMWATTRALGAGWWLSTTSSCKILAERIARTDFNATRNPDDAALWYIALGRKTALAALYKSQQNTRMAQFLLRNFDLPENKTAAGKNAYVLVSKHRLHIAIAFFILAGDVKGALNLIRTRLKDDQLAILLSRILADGEFLSVTLNTIVRDATEKGDDHRRSLALWLDGKHEEALRIACCAKYPSNRVTISDAEKALTGSLPEVVHALTHVLAMSERPPIRATPYTNSILKHCRQKAIRALLGDGSPVAALVLSLEHLPPPTDLAPGKFSRPRTKRSVETYQGRALLAAVEATKGRAICFAGAARSGATESSLESLLLKDLTDLRESRLGLAMTIRIVECTTFDLVKEDEVDAAVCLTYAAQGLLKKERTEHSNFRRLVSAALRNCLRVAVSRALLHVQGALYLLHYPTLSSNKVSELLAKYKSALTQMESAEIGQVNLLHRLISEFQSAVLALGFALAFLQGKWTGVLQALRACEIPWEKSITRSTDHIHSDKDLDDALSMTSCSSLAPDSVSIEALRHVASNPAILRISSSLGHIRRKRRTPLMSIVGQNASAAATVTDEALGAPTLSVKANDPFALIRIHPALSSTLVAASAAYIAAHLASKAADFAKTLADEAKRRHAGSNLFWQTESGEEYDQSFRLIKASATLEHLAEDAIAQWVPLQQFGVEANTTSASNPDESAGAFVDLWSTLGCLPEYAPSLSEAATVAAAEVAAAASRAAIEAAEEKDGGRRRRRRRERRGEVVPNLAKEGLKLFDTTSADSLYGAYPVRFSASAQSPWSGRGRHASLYSEQRALFRTLCVSSTDPPAIIVATPKGIQEIVPSSYMTMPAGFRSHYSSYKRQKRDDKEDKRLEALARDRDEESKDIDREDDESFVNSYDGFGEGPYVPVDMESKDDTTRRFPGSSKSKKAVWRYQVHATALASHPLRRRFASGGNDGVVRLWDFADPISLANFKEGHYGRVSSLHFSAYGDTMMAVYSSGHVAIWDDPDTCGSFPTTGKSRAKTIRAFDNRAASDGTFLDEGNTIAVVGDPSAPPSVGHSLRIFDTREAHAGFHASWSTSVNHQLEARCLALLEDRVRVVTGGIDGSLSVVDIRTKACVAELPAHEDEVTCLALEMPRGRAIVSGSADGEIKLWDSRTLLQLDSIKGAHSPTRHYWSGNGIGGLVGSYGTQGLALTDRSLISCGGDGVVKVWGPGWSDFDLNVL